jgi:hypothetical protein
MHPKWILKKKTVRYQRLLSTSFINVYQPFCQVVKVNVPSCAEGWRKFKKNDRCCEACIFGLAKYPKIIKDGIFEQFFP